MNTSELVLSRLSQAFTQSVIATNNRLTQDDKEATKRTSARINKETVNLRGVEPHRLTRLHPVTQRSTVRVRGFRL